MIDRGNLVRYLLIDERVFGYESVEGFANIRTLGNVPPDACMLLFMSSSHSLLSWVLGLSCKYIDSIMSSYSLSIYSQRTNGRVASDNE